MFQYIKIFILMRFKSRAMINGKDIITITISIFACLISLSNLLFTILLRLKKPVVVINSIFHELINYEGYENTKEYIVVHIINPSDKNLVLLSISKEKRKKILMGNPKDELFLNYIHNKDIFDKNISRIFENHLPLIVKSGENIKICLYPSFQSYEPFIKTRWYNNDNMIVKDADVVLSDYQDLIFNFKHGSIKIKSELLIEIL